MWKSDHTKYSHRKSTKHVVMWCTMRIPASWFLSNRPRNKENRLQNVALNRGWSNGKIMMRTILVLLNAMVPYGLWGWMVKWQMGGNGGWGLDDIRKLIGTGPDFDTVLKFRTTYFSNTLKDSLVTEWIPLRCGS